MKIVVLGTRGFPNVQGGVETHCEELYTRLAEENELKIFVYRRKSYLSGPVPDSYSYSKIKFIDFWIPQNKYLEALTHTFIAAVHCLIFIKPDIIHIHNIGPGLISPLLKIFNKKVVLTYHSQNYHHQKWNFLAKKALKLSEYISTTFSDALIFVSNVHKSELADKLGNKKLYYIPNGISVYDRDPPFNSNYLKNKELKENEFLLFIGRITPEKGIDYLIKAYIQSPQFHNYPLIIAGGDSGNPAYFNKLKEMALGYNVKFLGQLNRKELASLYRNCSVFILPSYFEGNPIVLLEAIAYKAKVIASDIPANLEVGLNPVHYFKCGNVQSLINSLERALNDSSILPIKLEPKYNWNNVAAGTSKVYKDVAL